MPGAPRHPIKPIRESQGKTAHNNARIIKAPGIVPRGSIPHGLVGPFALPPSSKLYHLLQKPYHPLIIPPNFAAMPFIAAPLPSNLQPLQY